MKRKMIQACTIGMLALASISAHAEDQPQEVKYVPLKAAALMAPGVGILTGNSLYSISKRLESRALSKEAAAATESGHRAKAVRLLKQSRELEEKSIKATRWYGTLGLAALAEGIYLGHKLSEHAEEAKIATQQRKAVANSSVTEPNRQPAEASSGSAQ